MNASGRVGPDSDIVIPAASRSLESRYQSLFEDALIGIYVTRPDGRLVACNAAFAQMLGFDSVAAAIGTSVASTYAGSTDRERFVARVRLQGRVEHHSSRLRRRDGRLLDLVETVVGEFDESGTLVELRGFALDVTASVEADLALLERERQFRAVFFDAADAMVILDDDRTIVDANPAACALFGAADGLGGRLFDDLLSDGSEAVAAAWHELLALGEVKREHRVRARCDAARLVECSYRARVHTGRHLCIARDITDRRLLEERLAQTEKIESVGRLAGGIAHDFNNLLTAILGYTELLLGERAADDPDRPDLEEIQKAGQRAASLTQQLLAFSRKQVLMPKDVDLNQIVSGLRSMLTRVIREDITLTCELAPAPAIVRIDPAQIEQAILNLVLNSRDAMPAGGEIRIDVSRVRRSHVTLPVDFTGSAAAEYVRLRIADNGVGIPPEAQAHLFEPFFTTKEIGKGIGLGLASVHGIVRQSNGFITVDTRPASGTAFALHFPAMTGVAAAPSEAVVARSPERETILLVEDEDAVRSIVGAVLRRQGYNVLEASSASGASEIFDDREREIDLLLTDVVMPGMNGPALAQRLVARRHDLRVLFISGYADMVRPLETDNPNVSFLSKPFTASILIDRVRQMLGRPDPLTAAR